MKILDEHIASDEPVLWRSPTIRDWATDHVKLLALPAGLSVLLIFLSDVPESIVGALVILFIGLGLVARIFPRSPAEALLTQRQLVFRSGLRRPKIVILARGDIAHVEVFGGDGTLVLSSPREELYRPVVLADPLEFARALDVPTTFWKPYEPTSRLWRLDVYLMSVAILATLGLASALVFVLPESFWEAVRSRVSDLPEIVVVAPALGIIALATIPSALVVAVLSGGLKRLLYPRNELNLMRCYKFNPLWRGVDPTTVATTGPRAALRAARLGFDRLINGPFPDCAGIEPEQYQPGAFPPQDEDEEGA